MLTELFTRVLDGRNANLTDGVQRALGRQPRDFGDYARAVACTAAFGCLAWALVVQGRIATPGGA